MNTPRQTPKQDHDWNLEDRIAVLLTGRAAELAVCNVALERLAQMLLQTASVGGLAVPAALAVTVPWPGDLQRIGGPTW